MAESTFDFFCNFWERQFELALCIGHALKLKTGAFASSVTGWKLKLALFVKFVDGQIGALKMTAFFCLCPVTSPTKIGISP